MYLFDTDTVTNPLKPRPSPTLVRRTAALPREQQHITSITLGEIVLGAYHSGRVAYHLERLQGLILPRVIVLPFDQDAAYRYGALRDELERAGTPLHTLDLQIAAIALSRGLILITGNTRHFERVPGLQAQNWLVEETE